MGSGANIPPPPPGSGVGDMGPPPQRFHTPAGHYSNPMYNVHVATMVLERIPLNENQTGQEARLAIDMLKTALQQQAVYPNFPDARRLHSTPYNSRTRSRHDESHLAGSSSGRRRELAMNLPHLPTASEVQRRVDEVRNRRAAAARAPEAAGAGGQRQQQQQQESSRLVQS